MADCILEDGNDGAHGPKLTKIEAGEVLDLPKRYVSGYTPSLAK